MGIPGDSVVKNHLPMQETRVQSLVQEDPLEKEMATHSNILAWKIPRSEEPGRLQSIGMQSWTKLRDWTTMTTKVLIWQHFANTMKNNVSANKLIPILQEEDNIQNFSFSEESFVWIWENNHCSCLSVLSGISIKCLNYRHWMWQQAEPCSHLSNTYYIFWLISNQLTNIFILSAIFQFLT